MIIGVIEKSGTRGRHGARTGQRAKPHATERAQVLLADDAMSANKSDASTAYERTRQVHDTSACRRDDQITSTGRHVRFCR
jgi:hypothetical protein